MCGENNNNNNSCQCLKNIIEVILKLQNYSDDGCCNVGGCDKPFLGPTPTLVCFNTRPINLYTCCNGTLWEFPYTLNGTTGTSNIFRAESLDGCCLTLRILAPNPDATELSPYVITNSYVTINLNCVGAIKCLPDVYVACA